MNLSEKRDRPSSQNPSPQNPSLQTIRIGIGAAFACVLAGGAIGWHLRPQSPVTSPFPYRFARPEPGSIVASLEREVSFYQERIQRNPTDGLDRAALAKTYLKLARATGNAQWYLLAEQSAQQSLTNLSFNNHGALLALARIAEAKHDFPEAIRLASQVLTERSRSEEARSLLVTSNLAIGKVVEADRLATELVAQIPTLGTLTLAALVKAARGQDTEAIALWQRGLKLEEAGEAGTSAWARSLFGRFYFKRGNLALAGQLYGEALGILPRYPLALVQQAELEVRLGKYRDAETHYAAVYISPAYPNIYDHVSLEGRARLRELQGDAAGAKDLWDRAETLLRQHLALGSFGHRRELAKLLLARGRTTDLPEALKLMEAEVSLRRDAETLDTYAWVLSRLQRWTQAREAMREVLERGTKDAGMLYRAASIERALGDTAAAIALQNRAQAIDSTFDRQAAALVGIDSVGGSV